MPARLPSSSASLATLDSLLTSSSSQSSSVLARSFSSTPCRERMTRERQRMYQWLNSREGQAFKANERRYLKNSHDQPFPVNPLFKSQPVLDERTRELIWEKVTKRGDALKVVSADMGVDVRRVAAVVRLKEVEKQWVANGKKLAKPYAKAVMSMLPTTRYDERNPAANAPHEPVNDVHIHRYTLQQLFVPVAESKDFTRKDAAKAFHPTMLSVDERSPQRGLIRMEKEIAKGKSAGESRQLFVEREQKQEEKVAAKLAAARKAEEDATQRVRTDRYEFRIKEINVDDVGPTGKSRKGTGVRYGAPFDDRKRGAIKIPTSVE